MAGGIPQPRWLPVGFEFNPTAASVKWIDFGSRPISEPFFRQTLLRLESMEPPAAERITDLSTFLEAASRLEPVAPSGLIFHVSRCGSTFLANALRTAHQVLVLSEPHPIVKFFHPWVFSNSPFPAESWPEQRRRFLSAISSIYAHHAQACLSKVVIKCAAVDILHIPLIRSVWPNTPCMVVIRDPLEVMVSNLAKPAPWLKSQSRPAVARRIFGWPETESQSMSPEEFCARGIGRFCESASRVIGDKCHIIDYSDMNITNIYKIADFFGLGMPAPYSPAVKHVIDTWAKDPEGARAFEDDHNRKQSEATESIREAAQRWAQESYELLKSMDRWYSLKTAPFAVFPD
jgi:hypothetical protein